ncbi:MAG: hypothetical protein LIQ31_09765 [Planctomycetes bacterium]|nr:hypothetical protein [Planctomycetota bacterium]
MGGTDRSEEERTAACREAFLAMGLGDYLDFAEKHRWDFLEDSIIRDPQGRAVVCASPWGHHIVESVGEVLGRNIALFTLEHADRSTSVFTTHDRLSIPERHTIAVLNRYFDLYRPGFRGGEGEVTLPDALRPLAAPVNFLDEADAFELAGAIRTTYGGWCADVAATDEGYAVVVRDVPGDLYGWAAERVAALVDVVESFSLVPKQKRLVDHSDDDSVIPPNWQNAVGERYSQHQRLEHKLDMLLDRMDGLEHKVSRLSDVFAKATAGKKRVAKSA